MEHLIEFTYVSTVEAKTTTQCHGETPGSYMHYAAIGDVNFTTEEQTFKTTFTVPSQADGMWIIAFNMAEIKEACTYTIKNVVWKLADGTQSLINQTGAENFYVKEGAGTDPYIFGNESAINSAVTYSTDSNAAFNLAGQRVANDFKGIVVKNGRKFIAK